MADKKKTPEEVEQYRALDHGKKDDRHNDNARASAALEQEFPRVNTDNI
jgi:hypothetical protein